MPEKFTGYHTGVDVEYEDVTSPVTVSAVLDGDIVYSGYVKGYGGFVAQKIFFNNQNYIVIYGHLKPASLIKNQAQVKTGDTLGILGQGYSSETDNERKHLHFAIIKGNNLSFLGYAQNSSLLSGWVDPLTFYP